LQKQKPWILVWDLDETLVTGWKTGWRAEDITVNPRAAFIMYTATKLRNLGVVKYIFLLTNNSDRPYINAAIKKLSEYIGYDPRKQLFDNKLINNPSQRTYTVSKDPYNPDKSLRDIDFLLKGVGGGENTAYRILFFDDRGNHVLRTQLPPEHYIQISPPFGTVATDKTPWERVLMFLRGAARLGGYSSFGLKSPFGPSGLQGNPRRNTRRLRKFGRMRRTRRKV
jgi:hypothetical protein